MQHYYLQLRQLTETVLQLERTANFVVAEIDHFEVRERIQVSDLCQQVRAQDQRFEVHQRYLETVDLRQLVRAEIEEVEIGQADQVLDLRDLIAVQVHVLDPLLAL